MSCRCSPCCTSALAEATAVFPGRSTASDGCCGDLAHQARVSDHNPYTGAYAPARGYALAFDLTHDPAHGCDAHAWADALRERCRVGTEKRVKYIISNRRIASVIGDWVWRPYTGSNPHDHHAHVSIEPWAYSSLSTWTFTNPGEDDVPLSKTDLDAIGLVLVRYHEKMVKPALAATEAKVLASEKRTRQQVRKVVAWTVAATPVIVAAARVLGVAS